MHHTTHDLKKSLFAASLAAMWVTGSTVAQAYGSAYAMPPDWRNPMLAGSVYQAGRLVTDQLQQAQLALAAKMLPWAVSRLRMALSIISETTGSVPYRSLMHTIKEARLAIHDHDPLLTAGYFRTLRADIDRIAQAMPYAPQTSAKTLGYLDNAEKAVGFSDQETADWKIPENNERADWAQADATLKSLHDYIDDHTVYVPLDYIADQIRAGLAALGGHTPNYALAGQAVGEALTVTMGSWVDDKAVQTQWNAQKEAADKLSSQRAATPPSPHWAP